MDRLWHCFNCGHDFQGPVDKCPQCQADGQDKASRGVIAPRVVVHFDPPHAVIFGRGLGYHACDPAVRVGTNEMRASGEPGVVNCPACQQTVVFREVAEKWQTPPAYRVSVKVESTEEKPDGN